MSELDTSARTAGNAAIDALRSALESADFRVRRFTAEAGEAQFLLEQARREVTEIKEALARLQGGESHEG